MTSQETAIIASKRANLNLASDEDANLRVPDIAGCAGSRSYAN